MNEKLGNKIRAFRERAGLSQMQLELEIEMSPGSLSRIENNQVNPTKETILNIAKALNLTDSQISYLFGLNLDYPEKILSIVNNLSSLYDIEKIVQTAVNEISEKLNYFAIAVFLFDKKKDLRAEYYSQNALTIKAIRMATNNFKSLFVNTNICPENYMLRSALEKKVLTSSDSVDFGIGFLPAPLLRTMHKVSGIKIGIAVPLFAGKKSLGSVYFCKKDAVDYSFEIEVLEALGRQISLAIDTAGKLADRTKTTH